jgi:hypothetical protein
MDDAALVGSSEGIGDLTHELQGVKKRQGTAG